MERARPEPPPRQRQLPRVTPPRLLRPALPPLPAEGTSFRVAAAEAQPSPQASCVATTATVAPSCWEAPASGVQLRAQGLLQVKLEQVSLLPPGCPPPQAGDIGATASPALLQRPPPPAPESSSCGPKGQPLLPRALHVKAEKQELGPRSDPSVGPRRMVEAGPRTSRAAQVEGSGPALDCPRRGEKKGKSEAEEVMRDTAEGRDGKGLTPIREGVIKTEEPGRPREECRLSMEPASSGLVHGSKEVIRAQPSSTFGPHQRDLANPLTLHTVPPGAQIQFQEPPPSELIRLTKVPLPPVPIKMQSLLEPSVKIETKDVLLTVLPSDAGISRQGNLVFKLCLCPIADMSAVQKPKLEK